jgi:hypothetical protein
MALGAIPGTESVEAVVTVMNSWDKWERVFGVALPAFHAHGIATEPFIDQVHHRLNNIVGPAQLGLHHMVLNQLRDAIRVARNKHYADAHLPALADLDEIRQMSDRGLRWDAVQGVADKPELSAESQRFRYVLLKKNSEVGVACTRLLDKTNRMLVTILVDECWYGASPFFGSQHLATALKELYDLDPRKTVWMVHQTASSGYTREGRDEFWLLNFAYDSTSCHYNNPKRTLYSSMSELLSALEEDGSRSRPRQGE